MHRPIGAGQTAKDGRDRIYPNKRTLKLTFRNGPIQFAPNTFTLAKPDNVMNLNSNPSLIKLVASLAVASLFTFSATAQDAKPRTAVVNSMSGEAKYSSGGGAFIPLAVGTRLHSGDIIKTSVGSHVDIDLDGNVGLIQVAQQSTFVVRSITTTETQAEKLTDTQLEIKTGAIYAKVNKLAKGSRYEIATPKGICGIRGTTVYLNADGKLIVEEGTAGMAYPKAGGGVDTFVLHDGQSVSPGDAAPHSATGEELRSIVEALRDLATHGIGRFTAPFIAPQAPFISPTLPPLPGTPANPQTPGPR